MQYSLEEFELMRPSIASRHRQVVRDMKTFMETKGRCDMCSILIHYILQIYLHISTNINIIYTARCRCDVCTRWMMEAVESRGKEAVSRLEVGFWTPAGPHLKDDLFPHVKGNFRGRVIPIASVHVSYSC